MLAMAGEGARAGGGNRGALGFLASSWPVVSGAADGEENKRLVSFLRTKTRAQLTLARPRKAKRPLVVSGVQGCLHSQRTLRSVFLQRRRLQAGLSAAERQGHGPPRAELVTEGAGPDVRPCILRVPHAGSCACPSPGGP